MKSPCCCLTVARTAGGSGQRPLQLIFAGKAHPRDNAGKKVLQEIARLARDERFLGKVVFVEDYDINVGRRVVQGVDVWLNNPRRPLEASGTSGQKVVLNGGLNLSVLDGWWAEAYDGANGFAIGRGRTHTNEEIHDRRDTEILYEVAPRAMARLDHDHAMVLDGGAFAAEDVDADLLSAARQLTS